MTRLTLLLLLALAPASAAQVVYVDDSATGGNDGTSWSDAFTSLQDALGQASAGTRIWLAEGTYRPDFGAGRVPGDRDASFELRSGVRIFGGFLGFEASVAERAGSAANTVLQGDLAGNDVGSPSTHPVEWAENSHRVVDSLGNGPGTVLDGLTIRGGHAVGNFQQETGGGMRIEDGNPRLSNVVFERNAAAGNGACLYVRSAHPTVIDCVFRDSFTDGPTGGAVLLFAGPPVQRSWFQGCRFERNEGGALSSSDADPILIDCRFLDNSSGAGSAVLVFGCSIDLVGCVLQGNVASFGGAMFLNATTARLQNCTFTGNTAQDGGAIRGNASYLELSGCTLTGNSAVNGAGGVTVSSFSVVVTDSVLWGNQRAGVFDESAQISGPATVDDSCVQGLTGTLPGAGNIGLDPLFVDADGADDVFGTADDDVRLTGASPCIDAGSAAGLLPDAFDLDGDGDTGEETPFDGNLSPRRFDAPSVPDTGSGPAPRPDMGAFEYTGPPLGQTYCSPSVANSSGAGALIRALGSVQTAQGALVLRCSRAPAGEFGYFLASRTQGLVAMPGASAGNLCLSGNIARFVDVISNSGPLGVFHRDVDLGLVPVNPPAAVMPGDTWHFQAWFRDGATSNFSEAVSVTFF